MKLISWNNGGLSTLGEGQKEMLVKDEDFLDALDMVKQSLREENYGPSWSPKISIYEIAFSYQVDIGE